MGVAISLRRLTAPKASAAYPKALPWLQPVREQCSSGAMRLRRCSLGAAAVAAAGTFGRLPNGELADCWPLSMDCPCIKNCSPFGGVLN